MILVMAMEEGGPWIVSDEIDFELGKTRHIDRVFHEPSRRFIADLRKLKSVAMQVDRMVVATIVDHRDAIALASLDV
jgi:hypothetical protein